MIPNLPGRYDNPICHTGPPGYIGWRNRSSESIPGLLKHLQIRALLILLIHDAFLNFKRQAINIVFALDALHSGAADHMRDLEGTRKKILKPE